MNELVAHKNLDSVQRWASFLAMIDAANSQLYALGIPYGMDKAEWLVWEHLVKIDEVPDNLPDTFDENLVAVLYTGLLSEIYHTVLTHPTPALALRRSLVSTSYILARYQVLQILPEPYTDITNIRAAELGITGELFKFTLDLVKACDELPNWELFAENPTTPQEARAAVLAECGYWNAKRQVLTELSASFDLDTDEMEWADFYLSLSCTVWEQIYREILGLPTALTPSKVGGILRGFSSLRTIIETGAKNPLDSVLLMRVPDTARLRH